MTFEEWWDEYSADRDWPWRMRGIAERAWQAATEAALSDTADGSLPTITRKRKLPNPRPTLPSQWISGNAKGMEE